MDLQIKILIFSAALFFARQWKILMRKSNKIRRWREGTYGNCTILFGFGK